MGTLGPCVTLASSAASAPCSWDDVVSTVTRDSANLNPLSSSSSSSEEEGCALFDFVAYTIVGGSLFLFGVVGNSLSFVVLQRQRGDGAASSATTLLLRALAVADTLVLIAAMPLYALTPISPFINSTATNSHSTADKSSSSLVDLFHSYYNLYPSIIPYLWPLYLIPYTATVWLTVLVSADRYAAVCRPFRSAASKIQSGSRSCRQVAFVVLLSVVYNIPRFFEYQGGGTGGSNGGVSSGNDSAIDVFDGSLVGTNASSNAKEQPLSIGLSDFGNDKIYRILYANVLYFIMLHGGPIVLLSFLNVRLIIALKVLDRKRMLMSAGRANASSAAAASLANGGSGSGSQQSQHMQQQQQQHHHHQQNQDLTLTLVVVVFVFITCQTPTFVDHVFWTVFSTDHSPKCGGWHYYYTAVGDVLAILNSSVNFIVYVVASPKFRRGLVALLVGRRSCCSSASDEAVRIVADGCETSRKPPIGERERTRRRRFTTIDWGGCCYRKLKATTNTTKKTTDDDVRDGVHLEETVGFLSDATPIDIQTVDVGLL